MKHIPPRDYTDDDERADLFAVGPMPVWLIISACLAGLLSIGIFLGFVAWGMM